jgi:hypothetical protein
MLPDTYALDHNFFTEGYKYITSISKVEEEAKQE